MSRGRRAPLLLLCACVAWTSCSRQHDSNAFSPSSPEFSGALTLSASHESVPADGFSRVQITARITGAAELDKRKVRFTTDNGDFPRESTAGTQTTEADVDSSGEVSVDLRSSTTVSIATVTAQVLARENNNETPISGLITRITVEFVAPDRGDIIRLSASRDRGEADGESVVFVHADVSADVPLASRSVVFTTTAGTFSNDTQTITVVADIGLRASAALKSPSAVGEALITAKVLSTTVELRLPFDLALPDAIVLEITGPKTLVRGAVEETTLEATLSRAEGRGTVTPGTQVSYSAFEKEYGEPLDLAFRNQTPSDDMQKSTATVSLGGVAFEGTATLRAEVGDVRGEADLEIQSPAEEPDISVAPPNLAFGDVAVGATADLVLEISNVGKETLLVSGFEITGGEFTVTAPPPLPAEIEEGGMVPVVLRFAPTHLGEQSGVLLIDSNDPQEGMLAVALSGEGI